MLNKVSVYILIESKTKYKNMPCKSVLYRIFWDLNGFMKSKLKSSDLWKSKMIKSSSLTNHELVLWFSSSQMDLMGGYTIF